MEFLDSVLVNQLHEYSLKKDNTHVVINETNSSYPIKKINDIEWVCEVGSEEYRIFLIGFYPDENKATFRINGKKVDAILTPKVFKYMKLIGVEAVKKNLAKDLKAPMPGLIKQIFVKEGDLVEKGTPLLVLEAMKMENILKASSEGAVKELLIQEQNTVDKNQVLITFQ